MHELLPFVALEAPYFQRKSVPMLAAELHTLPKELCIGIVCQGVPGIVQVLTRCFDTVHAVNNTYYAFANQGRIGIATGGHKVQIETFVTRLGEFHCYTMLGIED